VYDGRTTDASNVTGADLGAKFNYPAYQYTDGRRDKQFVSSHDAVLVIVRKDTNAYRPGESYVRLDISFNKWTACSGTEVVATTSGRIHYDKFFPVMDTPKVNATERIYYDQYNNVAGTCVWKFRPPVAANNYIQFLLNGNLGGNTYISTQDGFGGASASYWGVFNTTWNSTLSTYQVTLNYNMQIQQTVVNTFIILTSNDYWSSFITPTFSIEYSTVQCPENACVVQYSLQDSYVVYDPLDETELAVITYPSALIATHIHFGNANYTTAFDVAKMSLDIVYPAKFFNQFRRTMVVNGILLYVYEDNVKAKVLAQ